MIWDDNIDAQMIELFKQGMTAKKIGERLGTTKGSVIGRRARLVKSGRAPIITKPIRLPKPRKPPKPRGSRSRKPPIIDVHPAFDPKDNTWFFNGVEAKSIQDLIRKLPKGSTIKDYYKKIA